MTDLHLLLKTAIIRQTTSLSNFTMQNAMQEAKRLSSYRYRKLKTFDILMINGQENLISYKQ